MKKLLLILIVFIAINNSLFSQNFTEPITVETNGDAVLTFNNTDESWQYFQFKRNSVRQTWMGLSSGSDFVISKEGGGNIVLQGSNIGFWSSPSLWFSGKVFELKESRPVIKLNATGSLATMVFTNNAVNSSNHYGEFHLNHSLASSDHTKSTLAFSSYPSGYLLSMRSDGKVGIGTNSPETKLHIEDGVTLSGNDNATHGTLQFAGNYVGQNFLNTYGSQYSSGATSIGYAVKQKNGSQGFVSSAGNSNFKRGMLLIDDELEYFNGGAMTVAIDGDLSLNSRFKIDANGDVGIGTSNPSEKLEVNGNIHIPHDKTFGAGPGTAVKMWGIRGQAGSTQRLELYDRVSIGYPSGWNGFPEPPQHGLYIHGNAEMGNLSSRHYFTITSKEWPELRFETPTSNGNIRLGIAHANSSNYQIDEGDFYVFTNTVNKMPFIVKKNGDLRLNITGGNVAIGTTTTGSHKLAVEGSIGAREVKVEANGWSDFVFEDNYKLRSLEEVESYIETNKHLPDVPSEEEVLEEGINLGEMDAKLLQKIEELTLYQIELMKELNALKAEVKVLKNAK